MARGGKRQGAGRKTSALTHKTRALAEKIVLDGDETPLEVILKLMREAKNDEDKLKAAIAAAPYVHPKLAAVEMSGNVEKPLEMRVVSGVPRVEEEKQPTANGNAHHH